MALAVCGIVWGMDWFSSPRTRARAVHVGDSQKEVRRKLGPPVAKMLATTLWRTDPVAALFSDTAESWVYGQRFDLTKAWR